MKLGFPVGGFNFVPSLAVIAVLAGACGPLPEQSSILKKDLFRSSAPQTFTSLDSTETVLRFTAVLETKGRAGSAPAREKIREKIEAQLDHLFGPMAAARSYAAPRGDHRFQIRKTEPKPGDSGTFIVTYDFEGMILLKNGPRTELPVILPVNPDTIYEASAVKSSGGTRRYPCTDAEYDTEDDFWYYWNPAKPGCPLREGIDFQVLKGSIERIPDRVQSFPEYERLADEQGLIRIDFLVGMDDPERSRNPMRSNDLNGANLKEIRKQLLARGFISDVWPEAKIRAVMNSPRARILPYVEDLSKPLPKGQLTVRIFFGPTGIDENSRAFHAFFRDALARSSVMIYDGHSGLGANLDLAAIEQADGIRLLPARDRYQIYFFNSCSSYSYYNQMFFSRKSTPADRRGSRNLDILNNGLLTDFAAMVPANMALIGAIDDWAVRGVKTSYQELAKKMDSHNLFGVNGDEDNPGSR